MIILNCEPIPKTGTTECENVVVKDGAGYPFAILFADVFFDKDDKRIYDKIKARQPFQVKVELVE